MGGPKAVHTPPLRTEVSDPTHETQRSPRGSGAHLWMRTPAAWQNWSICMASSSDRISGCSEKEGGRGSSHFCLSSQDLRVFSKAWVREPGLTPPTHCKGRWPAALSQGQTQVLPSTTLHLTGKHTVPWLLHHQHTVGAAMLLAWPLHSSSSLFGFLKHSFTA